MCLTKPLLLTMVCVSGKEHGIEHLQARKYFKTVSFREASEQASKTLTIRPAVHWAFYSEFTYFLDYGPTSSLSTTRVYDHSTALSQWRDSLQRGYLEVYR